jgi:hypothetical protein
MSPSHDEICIVEFVDLSVREHPVLSGFFQQGYQFVGR